MAIVLDSGTEKILDSVLRALNADALRLPSVPLTAEIVGAMRTASIIGDTTIQVSNGHLWPKRGYIRFPGATDELATILRVRSRNGNKAPTWNGVGASPNAYLDLAAALAGAHDLGAPVYVVPESQGQPARAMDSGIVGNQMFNSLLKQFAREVTPATLTASGGSTTTVVDAGMASPYINDTQIGNKVTIVTSATVTVGSVSYVTGNNATTLTVYPAFDGAVAVGDTYTVEPYFFQEDINALDAMLPTGGGTSTGVEGLPDVSRTPGSMTQIMIDPLHKIIEQYSGTIPTTGSALEFLEQSTDPQTRLTAAALATDVTIHVEDASAMPKTGNIIIGTTTATILKNNARSGGQGPNTIRLSAVLGGGGEALGVIVHENPRSSVNTGRLHLPPKPNAFGTGAEEWVLAAVAAVEGFTVPAS